MTHHGLPDESRAARKLLKDYVNVRSCSVLSLYNFLTSPQGDLLWCSPPPNMKGATGVVPQPPRGRFAPQKEDAPQKKPKRAPQAPRRIRDDDVDALVRLPIPYDD